MIIQFPAGRKPSALARLHFPKLVQDRFQVANTGVHLRVVKVNYKTVAKVRWHML